MIIIVAFLLQIVNLKAAFLILEYVFKPVHQELLRMIHCILALSAHHHAQKSLSYFLHQKLLLPESKVYLIFLRHFNLIDNIQLLSYSFILIIIKRFMITIKF